MKVVVAGGGIAGLACALVLAGRGHEVTVLERRPPDESEGAGVILWPEVARLLDTQGLRRLLAMQGAPLQGLARRDLAGEPLQTFDFSAAPPLAVRRAVLMRVLADAASRHGVQLQHGCTVAAVLNAGTADRAAVVATQDGRALEADLVVGADGRMASVVGRQVRGATPVDHRLVSWIGIAPGLGQALGGVALDLWAAGARLGLVPCGAGDAYWAATVRVDGVAPHDDWRHALLARLDDRAGLTRDLITAVGDRAVHRYRLFDLDPGGAWHAGRLVLVGDAAHASLPTTGRGATEALLDAQALADALPPTPAFEGLQAALDRFTAARRAAAEANVHAARAVSGRVFGRPQAQP